jgi:O-antigen/teichoic acid export membrane protein
MIPEDVLLPVLAWTGLHVVAAPSPTDALFVYLIAVIVSVAVGAVWMRQRLPAEAAAVAPRYETKTWMHVALPMLFGGLSQISLSRADMLILGSVLEMADVGQYAAATRLAMLITFVLTAVNTIAAPMLASAYHSEHRATDFSAVFYRAALWSSLGALPIFAILFFWPDTLLGLFGAQFVRGSSLVRILAVGQFVNATTGPVGYALLVSGNERSYALTLSVVAAGMLVGNVLLVPYFGVTMAAAIATLGVVVLNSWQFLLARRSWQIAV